MMASTKEERSKIIRRVHAIAKKIWGTAKISGVPAYVFWTRVWAKLRYGVEHRRQLNAAQWLEMEEWLRRIDRHGKGNYDF